jgi:hypothetical protein
MYINIRQNDILIYNERMIYDDTIKYQLYYKEFLELKMNSTFINYLFEKILIIKPINYINFEYYY